MVNLAITDRIEHPDLGTFTLVVVDQDAAEAPGAMYHYAASPPGQSSLSADQWDQQTRAHALGLEARARGIDTPPAGGMADPGALGRPETAAATPEASAPPAPLEDQERDELDELRRERADQDQAARDRAELEQLRAERGSA